LLPAWSVSIVGGCGKQVTFNTAKIGSMQPVISDDESSVAEISSKLVWKTVGSKELDSQEGKTEAWTWTWWQDTAGTWNKSSSINAPAPLEQIRTTNDVTDYLWYSVSLSVANAQKQNFKANMHDFALIFVNNELQATSHAGNPNTVSLSLPAGKFTLNVLTQSVGLANYGAHYERGVADGLEGQVSLGNSDITRPAGGWTHQVGLLGESLKVFTPAGMSKVTWNSDAAGIGRPITWWRTSFPTPAGSNTLALDLSGLTKGFAYVNGNGIGRYWNIIAGGNCPLCSEIDAHCNYRGNYGPDNCKCDCGIPSQRYYHVPRDWLAPNGGSNSLVLIEELGAQDLSKVQLVTQM